MKNKLLLIFALLLVVCLTVGVFAACDNNSGSDDSKVDFNEGDSIVDNKDVEFTISPDGSSYTFTGKLITVNYLVKDGSKSYVVLSGEKQNELSIVGYKGEITALSVKDIEEGVKINNKPISINAVAENAFYGCTSLTQVDLTKANMSLAFTIGKNAFSRCTMLETVTLPDNVYTVGNVIGDYAFSYCSSLEDITVTDIFNDLGAYAFYGCSSLPSIELPDSIKVIKNSTFAKCSSLQTFSGASNLQSIQESAFEETALSEFNFASYNKLVYIGERAFRSTRLSSVGIPSNVTYIGSQAFFNLRNLQKVELPYLGNTIAAVSWQFLREFGVASEKYMQDRSVEVSIAVASQIPENAFAGCTDVRAITISDFAKEEKYSIYGEDGVSFNTIDLVASTDVGAQAFAHCERLTKVALPEGVTSMGNSAFAYCVSLKTASLGKYVEVLGDYAYYNCTNLQSVTLNENLEKIGNYAFKNTALTSVELSNNVESLGAEAFAYTKITSIALNDGLEEIGAHAFFGCYSLETFTIPAATTKIGNAILGDCVSLTTLTVNDYNYVDYGSDNDDSIGSSAPTFKFKPLSTLFSTTTERIGSQLLYPTKYGESSSFYVYLPTSLTSVVLNNVDQVAQNAFRGWTRLKDVTLSFVENPISIGINTYPQSICDYAFYNCLCLETLTLANGNKVEQIGSYAFGNCESFDADELAKFNGLKEILYRAFASSGIENAVTLPGTLKALGNEIFFNCRRITSLTFEDYDNTWNNNYSHDFSSYGGIVAALFGATPAATSNTTEQYYRSVQTISSGTTYLVPNVLTSVSLLESTVLAQDALCNMTGLKTVKITGTDTKRNVFVDETSLRGLTALTTLDFDIPSVYITDSDSCGILNGANKLSLIRVFLPTSSSVGSCYLANLFTTSAASSNDALPNTLKTVNLIASASDDSYIPSRMLYNAKSVSAITFTNENNIKSIGEGAFTNTSIRRTVDTLEVVVTTPAADGESKPTVTRTTYTTYSYNNWILAASGTNNTYFIPQATVGVAKGALNTCYTLYTNHTALDEVKSLIFDEAEIIAIEEGWTVSSKEETYSAFTVTTQNDSRYPFAVETVDGVIVSITSKNKTHSSTATYRITAVGYGSISFDYRASSEPSYDKLTVKYFNADGTEVDSFSVSGTTSGSKTYNLSDGEYLTFTYSKDGSSSSNDDCFYITNITLTDRSSAE